MLHPASRQPDRTVTPVWDSAVAGLTDWYSEHRLLGSKVNCCPPPPPPPSLQYIVRPAEKDVDHLCISPTVCHHHYFSVPLLLSGPRVYSLQSSLLVWLSPWQPRKSWPDCITCTKGTAKCCKKEKRGSTCPIRSVLNHCWLSDCAVVNVLLTSKSCMSCLAKICLKKMKWHYEFWPDICYQSDVCTSISWLFTYCSRLLLRSNNNGGTCFGVTTSIFQKINWVKIKKIACLSDQSWKLVIGNVTFDHDTSYGSNFLIWKFLLCTSLIVTFLIFWTSEAHDPETNTIDNASCILLTTVYFSFNYRSR